MAGVFRAGSEKAAVSGRFLPAILLVAVAVLVFTAAERGYVGMSRSSFIVLLFLVGFSAVTSVLMLLLRAYRTAPSDAGVNEIAERGKKVLAAEKELKLRIIRQRYADIAKPHPKLRPSRAVQANPIDVKESLALSRHRLEAGARQLEEAVGKIEDTGPVVEDRKEGAVELDRKIRAELEKLENR